MQYLYVPLGDGQLPVLTLPSGKRVEFPLFEIACQPLFCVYDLREMADETIADAARQAQEAIAYQLWSNIRELELTNVEAEYLAILVRVDPHAVAVSEPPHDIYDPPAEYDVETDSMILPEGAIKVGETEGYVGWHFTMILGIGLVPELPDGMTPEDAVPFFAVAPDSTNARELMKTPKGRAQQAAALGRTLIFGSPPEGEYTNLTELADRHVTRMQETL